MTTDSDAKPAAAKPAAKPESPAEPAAKPAEPDKSGKPAEGTESPSGGEAAESASATLGRGIAAAASNSGTTRARNAQRDHARRNLDGGMTFEGGHTTVKGDMVAGGMHVHYYGATATMKEVRATELADTYLTATMDTYVWPPQLQVRPAEPVVILRGAPGSGRTTTALALLNKSSRRRTILIDPKTVLEALASDRFIDSAGYVLDGRDGAAVTLFELQRLDAELAAHDCVLIITVSDRYTPIDAQLADRVVDIGELPEPIAVVRAHLTWHGRQRRMEHLASLLDGATAEILALLPGSTSAVGDFALLGKVLADAAGDLDVVRRRFDLRDSQDFETWFDELSDLYTQCFAIALAVLNSLPHQAVADAARALELLLDPKEEREKRTEAPTPFKIGRRRLLEHVRASVTSDTIETRLGPTPAEVVSFLDTGYPVRLLGYVWREHDHVRGPLVSWLSWLGRNTSDAVRVAAAVATGKLAVTSFDYVRGQVLRNWAGHEHADCRESAAIALEAPSADESLRATVIALVTEWAEGDVHQAATAARSCGNALGSVDPEAALSLLDDLIVREELPILTAACESLAEWVGGKDAVLRNRGITAMHDWTVNREMDKRTGGQLAFLYVANDLVAEDDPWPTLLRLARDDATVADRVVGLWSSALVNPELSDFARFVLASWASVVDSEPTAVAAFVELFRQTGSRCQAVLKHQAKGWLRDDADKPSPHTAAAILNAIG